VDGEYYVKRCIVIAVLNMTEYYMYNTNRPSLVHFKEIYASYLASKFTAYVMDVHRTCKLLYVRKWKLFSKVHVVCSC